MKKLKVLSLFSGIGAFEKALENIGQGYELINYCEIDKFASHAYSKLHNVEEKFNLGDITKVNISNLRDFDLLTHGSPCQSFSLAGKGEGGDEGSGTKSSLMWYSVNIIKEKRPKYVIWENVRAVTFKQHKHNFNKYLDTLEQLGYTNHWRVLNAKDYGAPQHRERVFVVSIRKDIKNSFVFPKKLKRHLIIRDILQNSEIAEKYYLKDNFSRELEKHFEMDLNKRQVNETGILRVGKIQNPRRLQMNNRVFSKDSVSPTLVTSSSEAPKIVECKIRKLMPLECWLIQGFSTNDYFKVKDSLENHFYKGRDCTDSQMYKMAGNSICVPVLENLFKSLFNISL